MLPARAGIPIVRRELTLRASSGEVVIGQRLGVLADEIAPGGGLDLSPGGPVAGRVGDGSALFSEVVGWPLGAGLTVVTTLDPAEQPFLHDHQIDGTPVLPGVMGVEAFAEAALLLHPERRVAAVEDVEFLAPFKFYRNEPRQLTVTCQFTADGEDLLARCALLGTRDLPGQARARGEGALHRHGPAGHLPGRARLRRPARRVRRRASLWWRPMTSIASTSTVPPIACWNRRG